MIPSMTQQQKLTTSSSSLSLLVFVALLFLLFLLLEKDCSRSSSSHHHRDKKAATKVLSSEKKKKKKKKRTSSSRYVWCYSFPCVKIFVGAFQRFFRTKIFERLTENFRLPFFLIKRKLKNTSSRGTSSHHHTRTHTKKNDDDENDDDDFEENDFDSSLPLRRELFVWDFNCFCRPGIPRQRAFLCVVFFLDHFSQNHHHRRGSPHSAPLPARRRRLRRVLSVCLSGSISV